MLNWLTQKIFYAFVKFEKVRSWKSHVLTFFYIRHLTKRLKQILWWTKLLKF